MSVILIFRGKTHKENENISDCQDYYQTSIKNNCFAIADGASQSFYPSIWAKLLVNHFCENPDINNVYDSYFLTIIDSLKDQHFKLFNFYLHTLIHQRQINQNNWKNWLQPIQEKWLLEVEQRVIKAKSENSPVWVTNQNRFNCRESATSTFIGLQFIGDKVKVSIVGDSCLFIVEDDQLSQKYKLIKTFLLERSKDFNDCPGYFASYEKDNNFTPCNFKIPLKRWKKPRGEKSQKNLFFILATDALSEYIFKCTENKNDNDIFETLLNISSQKIFEDFVASARNSDNIKMKNDDVTLLILSIPDGSIDQSSLQSRDEIEENPKGSPDSSSEEYGKGNNSSSQSTDEVKGNTKVSPSSSNKQSGKETKNSLNLNVIFQLMSAVKFPNRTQKSIPTVQISSHDELILIIEDLRNENTGLKYQRLVLCICIFGISLLFGINGKQENSTTSEQPANINLNQTKTNAAHVYTEKSKLTLKKGISIYKDQNLTNVFVNLLLDSSEVEIIEEGDKWTKFKIDVYIYKDLIINNCNDCKDDEIETIIPNTNQVINLRLSPDPKGIIFAQLKDKSRFKKIEFESKNWYKFEFLGYVKK